MMTRFTSQPVRGVAGRAVAGGGAQAIRRWAGRGTWVIVATMALLSVRVDGPRGAAPASGLAACRTEKPARIAAGALVICGGGGLPESVRREFVRLAGGPKAKIVVIPTASSDADGPAAEVAEFLEPWNKRGVASAVLLHTRSRAKADDPAFSRPLEDATGVWFSGGDQSRVTEVYLGTAVERALHAVLGRGGVIGGTSAGAAIMSRVMITGGREKATVGTGFGFLPGTVVQRACAEAQPDQSPPRRPGRSSRAGRRGRRRVHGAGGQPGAMAGHGRLVRRGLPIAGRRPADPDRRLTRWRPGEHQDWKLRVEVRLPMICGFRAGV